MKTSLLTILGKRKPAEVLLAGLKDANPAASLSAGQILVADAKKAGLSLPDYLRLAVNVDEGAYKGSDLDGYEASLAFLNLPIRDDFRHGILLEAAAETFQTFPGTRALFPPVIDDILQWRYRQDQIESVSYVLAQSRTVNGIEMVTTVVDDKAGDYQQTGVIAEGSNIPVRSIRTTEKSVKFYKFGGGFQFTYEFERRASLDLITPYAARMQREVEIGQMAMATSLLINGDGVAPAAPVVTATSLISGMPTPPTIVAGLMNWEVFLRWMINQAQTGVSVDTVVGNYDMYFAWQRMFATPTANLGPAQVEILAKAGVQTAIDNPRFSFNVNFALSSTAPANKLIGLVKNETLEELVENGSDIEESVRSIENQTVKFVKTTNRGYRLPFADTRSILHLV